jgi:hypothetical protein
MHALSEGQRKDEGDKVESFATLSIARGPRHVLMMSATHLAALMLSSWTFLPSSFLTLVSGGGKRSATLGQDEETYERWVSGWIGGRACSYHTYYDHKVRARQQESARMHDTRYQREAQCGRASERGQVTGGRMTR